MDRSRSSKLREGKREGAGRVNNGEEDRRVYKTASACGTGQSLAADRPGARPARRQHSRVLQAVQRGDARHRGGLADPDGDHGLFRPLLQLRDEKAARVLPAQEGGQHRQGFQGAGPVGGRGAQERTACARRRRQDEGPQCELGRAGDEDYCGLGPLHGLGGSGVVMSKPGKRFTAAKATVNRDKLYPLEEAVKLVKNAAKAKFDETIEVALNLGVDPRHADQMVRGVRQLPKGSGRKLGVGVFAKGAKAEEAKKAGADVVGAEDLVEQVQKGVIDFDRCIATPDMMPLVGRLGKVLGPRGLMPNPKVGTVTMDVAQAVRGAKGGAVEFRVEKAGIVQAGVGKASFTEAQLVENIRALVDAVIKAKPSGAKGTFLKRMAVASTMGPGVKIEPTSVAAGVH